MDKDERIERLRLGVQIQQSIFISKQNQIKLSRTFESESSSLQAMQNLNRLLNNVSKIIAQGWVFVDAYKRLSPGKDESFFFKHRVSGQINAQDTFNYWKTEVIDYLKLKINAIVSTQLNLAEAIDDKVVNALVNAVPGYLMAFFDKLVLDAYFSSNKHYSFSNFLFLYHQQFFNEQGISIDLVDTINLLKFDDIQRAVEQQSFDENSLTALSQQANQRYHRPDLTVTEFSEGGGHQPYLK